MAIIRIVEGENRTEVEGNWTVFTENFNMVAGLKNHFTSDAWVYFGEPEKANEDKESKYFEAGWWSSDYEGNDRITEAQVGQTVYFHIAMKNVSKETKISVFLYDDDGDLVADHINIIACNADGSKGRVINSLILEGQRGSLPITLSHGIESFAEVENDDDIRLYFSCIYEEDIMINLPKNKEDYLLVHTCDRQVEQSYQSGGRSFGQCEFYQYRYHDFMRRHQLCGHVPPQYYYGPMIKMNEETTEFYTTYALTEEMKNNPVNMSAAQIKSAQRLEVEAKPFPSHSYGFKYCVRFSQVLMPRLHTKGQKWLRGARERLQELMELGLLQYTYEAVYDHVKTPFVPLTLLANTFNKKFEPNQEEIIRAGNNASVARTTKKYKYYKNIELMNARFQEFAFATHPDAYNPKEMSELPIGDLGLIMLSPDFKEWIGAGAYGTWLQAIIVAGEVEYGKLIKENIGHYREADNSLLRDFQKLAREAIDKMTYEIQDIMSMDNTASFVRKNRITHETTT